MADYQNTGYAGEPGSVPSEDLLKLREIQFRRAEAEVKDKELDVRRAEAEVARLAASAPWWRNSNALIIALFAGIITLAGNVWVAYYNGVNTREQEHDRSTASLNEEKLRASNALEVEREKAKSTLILQAIATNDATKAYQNLQFFIESGVLTDTDQKIIEAAKKYPPFLPAAGPLTADTDPLGSYNADPSESSVSGFSSGAFMAVQFATAWSSAIKGVGIVAGGPDWCAQGAVGNETFASLQATGPCMKGPLRDLGPIFSKIDSWASTGEIDNTAYLLRQKIYIFHGYNDLSVSQSVSDATLQFYLHYLPQNNTGNIFYQNAIGAGHSQVVSGSYGLEVTA
jgi:hypothetical protein